MNEAWRDEVLLALNHACSQDPALIKEAERKLKTWETEAGFYSLLMVRECFVSEARHKTGCLHGNQVLVNTFNL